MKWLDENYKPTGAFVLGIGFFATFLFCIGLSPILFSIPVALIGAFGMFISGIWAIIYDLRGENVIKED